MRAVLQRAKSGSVVVEGSRVAEIGPGIVVLVGVSRNDTERDAQWVAAKLANIRIFDDADGKLNLSLLEAGGSALMVPNFTLYGDPRNGRRPSYVDAAPFEEGKALFDRCCAEMGNLGVNVERGVYGASMEVSLVNDGPVTLIVESNSG